MKDFRAGRLVKKVLIEQASNTADGAGGFTQAWSTFHTTFADISPTSPMKRLFGQQLRAETTHEITLRYKSGITSAMRVNYTVGTTTRIFQVHGVINQDERNRYMTLLCKEGTAS